MKLYFTCPIKMTTFASDDYALLPGHRVVEDGTGIKQLQGIVSLNSECPLCGQKHQYDVRDVLCPLTGGENAR